MGLSQKEPVLLTLVGCLSIGILLFTSCTPLKPTSHTENLQSLTPKDLKIFDGDFEIITNDTSFSNLAYIFTYNNYYNAKRLLGKCDRVGLKALDNNRIEVSVFSNEGIVRKKVIKGHTSNNYYHFKSWTISPIYFLLNGLNWQTNRMARLENGSLTVDTKYGGLWFLTVFPTIGGRSEVHNLIFNPKTKCH